MFDVIDNKIYLSRGDSAIIGIEITDDESEPYTPSSGESVVFTLKRATEQCKTIIVKEFIENGNDLIVSFDESDTINLSFGVYVYDVILYDSDGNVYTIIPPTEFEIMGVVHNEVNG